MNTNQEIREGDEVKDGGEDAKIEGADNLENSESYEKGSESTSDNESEHTDGGEAPDSKGEGGAGGEESQKGGETLKPYGDAEKEIRDIAENVPPGWHGPNLELDGKIGRPENGHITFDPYYGSEIPHMDIIDFQDEIVKGEIPSESPVEQASNNLENQDTHSEQSEIQTPDASSETSQQEESPPSETEQGKTEVSNLESNEHYAKGDQLESISDKSTESQEDVNKERTADKEINKDQLDLTFSENYKERLQEMANKVRTQFGIPIRKVRKDRKDIGGWNVDGRRIDITRWYKEGNRIMEEKLIEDLQKKKNINKVREQLQKVEKQFNSLNPPRKLDKSLVLATAYRESGNNLFKNGNVNTYYYGGLDYLGDINKKLKEKGYLPGDFKVNKVDVYNEQGRLVPAADIPADRFIEAYAAVIENARDLFKKAANNCGFDTKNIDKHTERAWTAAFFMAPKDAKEILNDLKNKGKLKDIFSMPELEKYHIIKRARVTAAEAHMLDEVWVKPIPKASDSGIGAKQQNNTNKINLGLYKQVKCISK